MRASGRANRAAIIVSVLNQRPQAQGGHVFICDPSTAVPFLTGDDRGAAGNVVTPTSESTKL
jgi:hypothetical protein